MKKESGKKSSNDTATGKTSDTTLQELQEKIEQLERKLLESEEIKKRAQSDYFRLKVDMDAFSERVEQQKKQAKHDAFIGACRQLLPFVAQLKNTLDSAGDTTSEQNRRAGVHLVYTKMIKQLEQMSVYPIESLHKEPDLHAHLPLGTEPADDKKMTGKVIKELEQGFVYKNDDSEIVIVPAKVIVGV